MRATERKLEIMKYLQSNGHVECTELAEKFGVSTMTIRRDLAKLEKEGLVTMEYGGAVLNNGGNFEHSMTMKQVQFVEEKMRIAKKCASYIKDGDIIYLDAGTTVCELAKLIGNRNNITVMTHSLLVANALAATDVNLIMCPGHYRQKSMAYMGQLTDQFISSFRVDKLFLGVEGVHKETGVSVQNSRDGVTKAKLIHQAKWVCCMADSSKFEHEYYYNISDWNSIDILVTDTGLDDSIAESYQKETELVRV